MKSDPNMHRAQKRPNQSADTSTATVGGVGQIFFEKIWDRSESMNVLRMANGKNPWRLAGRQSGEDGERRLAGAQLHGPNNPNPSTRGNEAQLNCVSLRSPLASQGRGELSGRIWLLQEGMDSFAGDLSEQEKKLVWATQCVPAPDLFEAKVGGTALFRLLSLLPDSVVVAPMRLARKSSLTKLSPLFGERRVDPQLPRIGPILKNTANGLSIFLPRDPIPNRRARRGNPLALS